MSFILISGIFIRPWRLPCNVFEMSISPVAQTQSVSVRKWYINEQTAHLFMEVMSTSVSPRSESVDVLLDTFECKTLKSINIIAPKKIKILSGEQKAPQKNNPVVANRKRKCRKAERRWRTSHLQIHDGIFKENLQTYNIVIIKARQAYFSDTISRNINNQLLLHS